VLNTLLQFSTLDLLRNQTDGFWQTRQQELKMKIAADSTPYLM
jgi:hypothetical protein